MPAEVETMMYVGERPWHGLGIHVEEAPTAADALRLAGLDWNVEQVPVYVDTGLRMREVPGFKAVRRTTDGRIYTVRSEQYEPFQNEEAFEFIQALLTVSDLKFETAGSLFHGKKIWALVRRPESIYVGGTDKVEAYVLLVNGHDGHTALQVLPTSVTVVCNNTLNMALQRGARPVEVRIRHTGGLKARVAEAQRILQITTVEMATFAQTVDALSAKDGLPHIDALLNHLFPRPDAEASDIVKKHYEEKREEVTAVIRRQNETAWGVLSGITQYVDHKDWRGKRDDDFDSRRMRALLYGNDAETKSEAARKLMDFTGIWEQIMRDREAMMVRVRR